MKRTHLFGTMMACTLAAAVSVGAQERPSTSQSDREGKNVVVTGCLKSGSSMAGGTSGTAGTPGTAGTTGSTASARGSFILTDANVASGSGSATGTTGATSPTGSTAGTATGAPAGTSGTSPSAAGTGKTYALVGGQSSELQGLLNSKVEIRGTLDQNASRSSGSGTGATGTGTTGTPTTGTPTTGTPTTGTPTTGSTAGASGMSHGDHPQLRVTSVRQIAGSCSEQ